MAARVEAATHVGGDFYTFLPLGSPATTLGIVAVDVMGQGMEGAVTAMRFSETLRYEARNRVRPVDIMRGLNLALQDSLLGRHFVGCCVALLDAVRGTTEIAVGGYFPPLRYAAGDDRVVEPDLAACGLPLGVRGDAPYESTSLPFECGDVLLFYSDGLVEAQDDRGGAYGHDRLRELFEACARDGMAAAALLERLFWDLDRFTASSGRGDDITVIAVRGVTTGAAA